MSRTRDRRSTTKDFQKVLEHLTVSGKVILRRRSAEDRIFEQPDGSTSKEDEQGSISTEKAQRVGSLSEGVDHERVLLDDMVHYGILFSIATGFSRPKNELVPSSRVNSLPEPLLSHPTGSFISNKISRTATVHSKNSTPDVQGRLIEELWQRAVHIASRNSWVPANGATENKV